MFEFFSYLQRFMSLKIVATMLAFESLFIGMHEHVIFERTERIQALTALHAFERGCIVRCQVPFKARQIFKTLRAIVTLKRAHFAMR